MKKQFLSLGTLALVMIFGATACSRSQKSGAKLPPANRTAAAVAEAANNPVSFKIKWIPGKKYHFQVNFLQGVNTPSTNPDPNRTVFGCTHDYLVSPGKIAADGGQVLDLQITDEKFFYQWQERGWFKFDSREDLETDKLIPVCPLLRQLEGAHLRCWLGADGQVVRMEGFDKLKAEWDKAPAKYSQILESIFNEENFKMAIEAVAQCQPADPIKVGDKWPMHYDMDIPTLGSAEISKDFTFEDWDTLRDRDCIRVSCTGKMALKAGDNPLLKAKLDNSSLAGTLWYDPALGTVIDSSFEQHMTVTGSVLGQTNTMTIHATGNARLISMTDE